MSGAVTGGGSKSPSVQCFGGLRDAFWGIP